MFDRLKAKKTYFFFASLPRKQGENSLGLKAKYNFFLKVKMAFNRFLSEDFFISFFDIFLFFFFLHFFTMIFLRYKKILIILKSLNRRKITRHEMKNKNIIQEKKRIKNSIYPFFPLSFYHSIFLSILSILF